MRKQTPNIEWVVVESDAEWERLSAQPPGAGNYAPYRKHTRWRLSAILLLLMGIDGWLWHIHPASSPPANVTATLRSLPNPVASGRAELEASVISDVRASLFTRGSSNGVSAAWPVEFSQIESWGGGAVVSFVAKAPSGTPVYRQTRFYQRTTAGWQPAEPNVALWGPERSLETASFVFSFQEKDEEIVSTVASQMEVLYATLRHNFGLPISPDGDKLRIDVSLTSRPGAGLPRPGQRSHVTVAAPALYLTPVALSDDQILAQSMALPLLDAVMAQVVAKNHIDPAWQPLRNGLRLWQFWELDLPLASWRTAVVKWLYFDVPTTSTAKPVVLPKDYATLCAMHRLWLPTPWQLGIPVGCAGLDQNELYRVWWNQRQPPTHLAQLEVSIRSDRYVETPSTLDHISYPGQTVALATLVEYAVATYGREHLTTLLAGLGQYHRWETLIPAVYGVSPAEFEAGWQTYLAAHYGVATDISKQ